MLHRVKFGIAALGTFAAFTAVSVSTLHAQVVLGPVSISSPGTQVGSNSAIQKIIDQSGLTVGYTSGESDFASYVASTSTGTSPQLSGIVVGQVGDPRLFSFDLGAEYAVSAIGIWTAGTLWSTEFELFADDDFDFTNGVGASILGSSTLSLTGQAFSFSEIRTRYVHFTGPAVTARSASAYGLSEVVFGGRTVSTVPEPSMLALFLAGLALLTGAAMRRRA